MPQPHRSRALVFWIIWFCFLFAVVQYQLYLGHGFSRMPDVGKEGWTLARTLALIQILAATAIRWLVIPRTASAQRLLAWMIVGIALSEAVEFYGIFLVGSWLPQTKLVYFWLALFSTAQFAPFYGLSRKFSEDQVPRVEWMEPAIGAKYHLRINLRTKVPIMLFVGFVPVATGISSGRLPESLFLAIVVTVACCAKLRQKSKMVCYSTQKVTGGGGGGLSISANQITTTRLMIVEGLQVLMIEGPRGELGRVFLEVGREDEIVRNLAAIGVRITRDLAAPLTSV